MRNLDEVVPIAVLNQSTVLNVFYNYMYELWSTLMKCLDTAYTACNLCVCIVISCFHF